MFDEKKRNRPSFTVSVGELIALKVPVRANCETCGKYRDIDLAPIAAKMGADYDLWDRKTRCRLTEGCKGFNYFSFYGGGMFKTMRG